MPISLDIEPVAAVRDGMAALADAHWTECGVHKDAIPLDVDWDKIAAYETIGMWKSIVMRRDGRMIGYSNWVIGPPLHYRSTIFANNDSIYLDPSERNGWAGVRLIRGAEPILRGLGVRRIIYHARPFKLIGAHNRPLAELFVRLGYGLDDTLHSKVLE